MSLHPQPLALPVATSSLTEAEHTSHLDVTKLLGDFSLDSQTRKTLLSIRRPPALRRASHGGGGACCWDDYQACHPHPSLDGRFDTGDYDYHDTNRKDEATNHVELVAVQGCVLPLTNVTGTRMADWNQTLSVMNQFLKDSPSTNDGKRSSSPRLRSSDQPMTGTCPQSLDRKNVLQRAPSTTDSRMVAPEKEEEEEAYHISPRTVVEGPTGTWNVPRIESAEKRFHDDDYYQSLGQPERSGQQQQDSELVQSTDFLWTPQMLQQVYQMGSQVPPPLGATPDDRDSFHITATKVSQSPHTTALRFEQCGTGQNGPATNLAHHDKGDTQFVPPLPVFQELDGSVQNEVHTPRVTSNGVFQSLHQVQEQDNDHEESTEFLLTPQLLQVFEKGSKVPPPPGFAERDRNIFNIPVTQHPESLETTHLPTELCRTEQMGQEHDLAHHEKAEKQVVPPLSFFTELDDTVLNEVHTPCVTRHGAFEWVELQEQDTKLARSTDSLSTSRFLPLFEKGSNVPPPPGFTEKDRHNKHPESLEKITSPKEDTELAGSTDTRLTSRFLPLFEKGSSVPPPPGFTEQDRHSFDIPVNQHPKEFGTAPSGQGDDIAHHDKAAEEFVRPVILLPELDSCIENEVHTPCVFRSVELGEEDTELAGPTDCLLSSRFLPLFEKDSNVPPPPGFTEKDRLNKHPESLEKITSPKEDTELAGSTDTRLTSRFLPLFEKGSSVPPPPGFTEQDRHSFDIPVNQHPKEEFETAPSGQGDDIAHHDKAAEEFVRPVILLPELDSCIENEVHTPCVFRSVELGEEDTELAGPTDCLLSSRFLPLFEKDSNVPPPPGFTEKDRHNKHPESLEKITSPKEDTELAWSTDCLLSARFLPLFEKGSNVPPPPGFTEQDRHNFDFPVNKHPESLERITSPTEEFGTAPSGQGDDIAHHDKAAEEFVRPVIRFPELDSCIEDEVQTPRVTRNCLSTSTFDDFRSADDLASSSLYLESQSLESSAPIPLEISVQLQEEGQFDPIEDTFMSSLCCKEMSWNPSDDDWWEGEECCTLFGRPYSTTSAQVSNEQIRCMGDMSCPIEDPCWLCRVMMQESISRRLDSESVDELYNTCYQEAREPEESRFISEASVGDDHDDWML